MRKLPNGWSWMTLGDLADYQNGAAFKPADWENRGTPIVRIQNLTDPAKPLNRTTRQVSERHRVRNGDILVSWSATLDAFIWERGEAWLNQHIFRVVPNTELIDKRFLFLLLSHEIAALVETEHLHGSTMTHINRGPFLAHRIALPPRSEQVRIVMRLQGRLGKLATARDELSRLPRLVQRYKEAILVAAFCGDLTHDWRLIKKIDDFVDLCAEVAKLRSSSLKLKREGVKEKSPATASWKPVIQLPMRWRWISVDQLATLVQYGSSAKTSESRDDGVPVLRMGNIIDGRLDYSKLKYLPTDHEEFPKLLLLKGDILFNRTNSAGLVGKTAVFAGEGRATSFASYLIRLRIVGYVPELLSAYINSPYGRDWTRAVANQQVGQANVNSTKLRELAVPLMPPEEQKEVWTRIERAFAGVDKALAESSSAQKFLKRLEQAILAKALCGEPVPHGRLSSVVSQSDEIPRESVT